MKKQVIIIHGGFVFDSYEDYINSLKNYQAKVENFKDNPHWQSSLSRVLAGKIEVFSPRMPNRNSAKYEEWKIWFEKMTPFIKDEVTLVGYSLGGIFLAKYLSENVYPVKIKAFLLVAAPFDTEDVEESLGDFILSQSLEKISNQVEEIYLIFSKDDPVVPFLQLDKYRKALPNSRGIVFDDRGHFYQEFFPEIVELIKKL